MALRAARYRTERSFQLGVTSYAPTPLGIRSHPIRQATALLPPATPLTIRTFRTTRALPSLTTILVAAAFRWQIALTQWAQPLKLILSTRKAPGIPP